MIRRRVTFATKDAALFADEVKRRVADYFVERGVSDKANGMMVLKGLSVVAMVLVPYALLLTNRFSPWSMLALAVLIGVGIAGVGFSVSHDALHGAYSNRPGVNRLIGLSFDLIGANGYMWKITHNVIHHTYTNIHGLDEDLTVSPLLRLSPRAAWRPIHRYQHLYAFLAYSFSTLFWVFVKDYRYFLQRDLGPYTDKRHPRAAIAVLFAGKASYYVWAIVVPLLVLHVSGWQFLVGFLAMNLTAGAILGIVFQLAHVVETTEHPEPGPGGAIPQTWLAHELMTTSNFGRRNRLLCWYVGGLNYQVEHHLFPKVCSIHYPAISGIVREVAEAHGLPYNQHETLRDAIRSHYQALRQLGRPQAIAAAGAVV